jgi:ankyrin repeat protein
MFIFWSDLAVFFFSKKRPAGPDEKLDRAGRSDLHYAARDGNTKEVKRLLDLGFNVNLKDVNGHTPLHIAAQEQKPHTVEALLDAGAEIEAKDKNGHTPLAQAVFYSRGDGDTIRLLRGRGADPYAKNNHGVSPIDTARQIANYDIAQYFNDLPDE